MGEIDKCAQNKVNNHTKPTPPHLKCHIAPNVTPTHKQREHNIKHTIRKTQHKVNKIKKWSRSFSIVANPAERVLVKVLQPH